MEANAPEEVVALFAEQLIADSDLSRDDLPESLRVAAAQALASVALQIPDELKPVTLERLDASLVYMGALDLAKASARTLIRLTQLGEHDAAERLIQLFLEGRPLQDIGAPWVGDIIAENSVLKDQVVAAAAAATSRRWKPWPGLITRTTPTTSYGPQPRRR